MSVKLPPPVEQALSVKTTANKAKREVNAEKEIFFLKTENKYKFRKENFTVSPQI
ncbi:MAG: hypothetical protein ACRBBJ_10715 [Rhodomicrobiaceae bacterium]